MYLKIEKEARERRERERCLVKKRRKPQRNKEAASPNPRALPSPQVQSEHTVLRHRQSEDVRERVRELIGENDGRVRMVEREKY